MCSLTLCRQNYFMYHGGTIVSLGQKSYGFGLNPCYGVHGINNITTWQLMATSISKSKFDWCRLH